MWDPVSLCWEVDSYPLHHQGGLPRWLVVKNLPANAIDVGDIVSIPGSGRSPGGGNGNPLQYSCLGNPMDKRVWWGRKARLSMHAHTTREVRGILLSLQKKTICVLYLQHISVQASLISNVQNPTCGCSSCAGQHSSGWLILIECASGHLLQP